MDDYLVAFASYTHPTNGPSLPGILDEIDADIRKLERRYASRRKH
ncbi:MAG: hypothetical protein AABW63_03870 [Nanoarchaeota archaeon]